MRQRRDRSDTASGRKLVAGLTATFLLMSGLMVLLGADPLQGFHAIVSGALGNRFGLGETLVITSVLVLTGLAAAIPFSAGMWNVGGEGQMLLGAFAATAAAFVLPSSLPPWVHAPLSILAAVGAGAIWGFIPAAFKVLRNANEVIITLMLVFVATFVVEYGIRALWPSPFRSTVKIPDSAVLPVIWQGTRMNSGVFLGVAGIVLGWLLLARTSLGFCIKATGQNPRAARMNGINLTLTRTAALTIGGAFAGAAGAIAVLGIHHALVSGFSPGWGFIGIAVALMARLSPAWIVPSALIFAVLRVGGNKMQVVTGLDPAIGNFFVAILLIMILALHVIRVRQLGSLHG